jgi:hypothetical protein
MLPIRALVPGIWIADTGAEVFLMDGCGGPGERLGTGVVALDEGIDLVPDLLGRGEAGALEGGAAEDRDQISTWFIQEAWVGVKWKWTLGWRGSHPSRFGLWVLRLSSTTWMSRSG